MKLVYANATCSLGIHIMLEELGKPYEAIRVDFRDRRVLESYNPLGYVPVLVLDSGEVMTEGISLLQHLARENKSAFFPKDPFEKTKCIEWLTFISTELHKGAAPLFHLADLNETYTKVIYDKLEKRLQVMEDRLQDNAFLMGLEPTIADFYALGILRVLKHVKVPLEHFEAITKYKKNLEEDPVILKILKLEQSAPIETKVREIIPPKGDEFTGAKHFQ